MVAGTLPATRGWVNQAAEKHTGQGFLAILDSLHSQVNGDFK